MSCSRRIDQGAVRRSAQIASRPAWSIASNASSWVESTSSTAASAPLLSNTGVTISELERLSQAMWPGNACTSGTMMVSRRAAAAQRQTIIVPDVHAFPGHIACDSRSNSEIVTPVFDKAGALAAVLDVDSTQFGAFDAVDQAGLEGICGDLLTLD